MILAPTDYNPGYGQRLENMLDGKASRTLKATDPLRVHCKHAVDICVAIHTALDCRSLDDLKKSVRSRGTNSDPGDVVDLSTALAKWQRRSM